MCSLSANFFFSKVIALDTSPTGLTLARHNAQIYSAADRIEFILPDYHLYHIFHFHRRHTKYVKSRQVLDRTRPNPSEPKLLWKVR